MHNIGKEIGCILALHVAQQSNNFKRVFIYRYCYMKILIALCTGNFLDLQTNGLV
jgi:hypothetical protein